jgi:hypothetical protein
MTYFQVKGNKYRAKSSVYNGTYYHSQKEAAYAQELDLRVKAKDIKSWERQVKISLDVNGYHIANYIIDFVITHMDDTKEYVEIKGFETDTWRMKWRLFEAIYGTEFAEKNWTMTLVK